jgi:hypothetical protein
MSKFEILSLLVSTLAAVIACISLVRARKLAKEQLELARVTADLSRLQIESIAEKKSNKIKPKFNVNLTTFIYLTLVKVVPIMLILN